MMAMMEHAAMDCVQPDLPEGKAPWAWTFSPATWPPPLWGMTVRATATVTGVSENGKLITFRVEASDDWGPIGEGTHTRGRHCQRPLPAEVQQQADGAEITPAASKEGGERRSPPSFLQCPQKKLSRPFKSSCNQRTGTV